MFKHALTTPLIALGFAAVFLGGTANADVILADGFDGVSKTTSSNVATIASWDIEAGVAAGTSFTAVDEGGAAALYEDAQIEELDVDVTVWSVGDGWDVSFTFALDAGIVSIDLDTFDLVANVTSNGGTYRSATNSDRQWTFTITGDGAYGTQSASTTTTYNNGNVAANQPTSIDLSGFDDLVAGENYTATVGVRWVSGDLTYMSLDSVSLSGTTIVPEPAALALIGLGGLLIAGRRRG